MSIIFYFCLQLRWIWLVSREEARDTRGQHCCAGHTCSVFAGGVTVQREPPPRAFRKHSGASRPPASSASPGQQVTPKGHMTTRRLSQQTLTQINPHQEAAPAALPTSGGSTRRAHPHRPGHPQGGPWTRAMAAAAPSALTAPAQEAKGPQLWTLFCFLQGRKANTSKGASCGRVHPTTPQQRPLCGSVASSRTPDTARRRARPARRATPDSTANSVDIRSAARRPGKGRRWRRRRGWRPWAGGSSGRSLEGAQGGGHTSAHTCPDP